MYNEVQSRAKLGGALARGAIGCCLIHLRQVHWGTGEHTLTST